MTDTPVAIADGRIMLANAVFVYIERTLAPAAPLPVGTAPRPYGLAPLAVSSASSVLAAVGPGEAVWLGFQSVERARPATVRVRVERPEPLDAVTGERWEDELSEAPRNFLVCPPDYSLPGLRRPAGFQPFRPAPGADGVETLTVLSYGDAPAQVEVRLVTPVAFTRATGVVPDPVDPENAYKGWRLP